MPTDPTNRVRCKHLPLWPVFVTLPVAIHAEACHPCQSQQRIIHPLALAAPASLSQPNPRAQQLSMHSIHHVQTMLGGTFTALAHTLVRNFPLHLLFGCKLHLGIDCSRLGAVCTAVLTLFSKCTLSDLSALHPHLICVADAAISFSLNFADPAHCCIISV